MIDIDSWIDELEQDSDETASAEYQKELFESYVLRNNDRLSERKELFVRFKNGEPLTGEKGLRKALAAFDLSYFGRAYLSHYFTRKSPAFHEELDRVWTDGVMKGKNPIENSREISGLKGSRNVTAAPRGHAKSTNLTFKDTLHAVLYKYKLCFNVLKEAFCLFR